MRVLKHKKIILFFLSLALIALSSEVLALEVLGSIPSPTGRRLTDDSSITELVAYFYEWGIALRGLAAFIALVSAGFQYLTSMGDPAKMKDAKDRIVSAILGLILLLSSWLILNTINPKLTTLTAPSFSPPSGESEPVTTPGTVIPRCEKVTIYSGVRKSGTSESIERPREATKKVISFTPNSIEVDQKNGCQVLFYKDNECNSDNFISPIVTEDRSELHPIFSDELSNIRCIKVQPIDVGQFPETSPYEFQRP